jgi:hypothetical protein
MLINYELEQLEIDERLNSKSFQNVPIQFGSTTYLIPAREIFLPCDEKYQKYLSPVWDIIVNDSVPVEVVFTYPTRDKSLNEVKEEIINLLPIERKNRENVNINIEIGSEIVEISTNKENRTNFIIKYNSLKDPEDKIIFKFGPTQWLEVDKYDLENILSVIDNKVQEAFDWEFAKIQEINDCTTIDSVYAVNITSHNL